MLSEILRHAFPALVYLVLFRAFSSVGKESDGGNTGLAVRIPVFLHKILFPGAPYDTRSLLHVLTTISCLACFALTVILTTLIALSKNETLNKLVAYRLVFGFTISLFIVSVLIFWIVIAIRDKRLPLLARIVIVGLALAAFFIIFRPFIIRIMR